MTSDDTKKEPVSDTPTERPTAAAIRGRELRAAVATLERWLNRQDYDEYNDTIAVSRSALVTMYNRVRKAMAVR